MKAIIIILCMGIFVSCGAVLSPEQCSSINWYEKGVADGTAGEDFRLIDDYKLICGKASVIPDEKMYYAGYYKGIKEYCTYDNGFQAGRRGGKAKGCPDDTEYFAGWQKGMKEYVEERERREIEQLTRPGNTEIAGPAGGGAGQSGP